ncbi:MAG: transcription antitermination factor NusB [Clostridia bacterium]|nr:transcription antitermination factor NusB [Clostridia bacterium]
MSRSKNREEAFKLLYSIQINKDTDYKEQINLFCEIENIKQESTISYMNEIVEGVVKNNESIEKEIEYNIKSDWTISRISKIDITLLKLGIYEIVYSKLPYKVVINEVVELSKKYGDDKSKSFVNGVLASIVKKHKLLDDN